MAKVNRFGVSSAVPFDTDTVIQSDGTVVSVSQPTEETEEVTSSPGNSLDPSPKKTADTPKKPAKKSAGRSPVQTTESL